MQANVIPILIILSNITCVALKLAITLFRAINRPTPHSDSHLRRIRA